MSDREQRRFPRVNVLKDLGELLSVLGAEWTWSNGELSTITDLSYRGVAVRRPGIFPFAAQQDVDGVIRLGVAGEFNVKAKVVWFNLEMVGLEMQQIPPAGHAALAEYLDAKLVGASLRPIERSFFTPGSDFDQWFQTPSGTHVFVWLDGPKGISRVGVTFADLSFEFQRGRGANLKDPLVRRALLIVSQMDKPSLPMEEFVRSIGAAH